MNGDAKITTMLDQCMVKLLTRCDGTKDSAVFGEVRIDELAAWCS